MRSRVDVLIQSIYILYYRLIRYSLALVFWEVVRRTRIDGFADEYSIPYNQSVPNDPSFEDMKKVVCVDQQRPPITERWQSNQVLIGKLFVITISNHLYLRLYRI